MKILILLLGSGLLLFSCNNPTESIDMPNDFDGIAVLNVLKNPENFSESHISKIIGVNSDQIRISKEYFSPDMSQRSLLFSWPNGKQEVIQTLNGEDLKLDAYNSIGLGFLKRISKEEFAQQFESTEYHQKRIQGISEDESIDSDIAIFEMKEIAKETQVKTFEKMNNLGELAYWEKPNNALHIYANGIAFTITTNMDSEEKSKKAALELVKNILNSKSQKS